MRVPFVRLHVVVSFLLLASGTALADGPVTDAERLHAAAEEFDAGRRSFKSREYEKAAIHFETADRDAPAPEALLGAIRARKDAGHHARAATLAAAALARYPNDKTLTDYARRVVNSSDKLLHRLLVSCTPECALVIDNKVHPAAESVSTVIYLDPGPHAVVAGWSQNRRQVSDIVASAGMVSQVNFEAQPLPDPEPPPVAAAAAPAAPTQPVVAPSESRAASSADAGAKSSSGLPTVVFSTGVVLTVALGAVTAWSGLDTVANPGADEVRKQCIDPNGPGCATNYELGLGHQRRTNTLLGVTAGVGVTTAIVGLFFTNWDGAATPRRAEGVRHSKVSFSPVVDVERGITIGALGSF